MIYYIHEIYCDYCMYKNIYNENNYLTCDFENNKNTFRCKKCGKINYIDIHFSAIKEEEYDHQTSNRKKA